MINKYAKFYRIAVRFAFLLASVGGFSVAHAINKGQMGQYRYQTSGNTIGIGPNQYGVSGASAAVGDLRGNIGTPIGNSGWYHGGNAPGSASAGPTMQMGHFGDVYFSGSKYPFQATYQVPRSAIIDGLGMLCKNPVICMGLSLAAPAITDWLSSGDVRVNANEKDYPDKPFEISKYECTSGDATASGCIEYVSRLTPNFPYRVGSKVSVCQQIAADGGERVVGYYQDGCVISSFGNWPLQSRQAQGAKRWLPASMDDIAPYMTPRDVTPNVVRDLIDQGADIKLPSAPTVTGPSSVTGPTTTTQNPDGSTTTIRTVSNFSTAGNTITNISNTTITQTCSGTGNCSPSTSTTVENPKPDNPSDCEKNPDALMCQKPDLDTPSGDIPKSTKSVAYQAESLFGGGSCPANKTMTVHATGQQITVWDWNASCGWITGAMRPIVLILCGFAAFVIVAGGTKS